MRLTIILLLSLLVALSMQKNSGEFSRVIYGTDGRKDFVSKNYCYVLQIFN